MQRQKKGIVEIDDVVVCFVFLFFFHIFKYINYNKNALPVSLSPSHSLSAIVQKLFCLCDICGWPKLSFLNLW